MKRVMFVLLLAGCSVTPPTETILRDFIPDNGGISVQPDGMRIDFGRAPSGVVPVLNREIGREQDLGLVNCPAGIVQQLAWEDMVLTFTKERFVGWKQADRSVGLICG